MRLKTYLPGLVFLATLIAIGYVLGNGLLQDLLSKSWIDGEVRGRGRIEGERAGKGRSQAGARQGFALPGGRQARELPGREHERG